MDAVPPEKPPRDAEGNGFGWARWTGVGIEFGASVLLFFLLGSWADATWGTRPWMTVAGSALGVVVATYLLVKQALESFRSESRGGRAARPSGSDETPSSGKAPERD